MKQIETTERIRIMRSQIKLNPLNPKSHTDEAIKKQVRNFKKVGFLGGVVWNKRSGNLIDGHRRVYAMDLYYGYAKGEDYELTVDVCDFDDKTEKEQMTYMAIGNTKADFSLIAQYSDGLDLDGIGVSTEDIESIQKMMNLDAVQMQVDSAEDLFDDTLDQLAPKPQTRQDNDIPLSGIVGGVSHPITAAERAMIDPEYDAKREACKEVKRQQAFQSYSKGMEAISNLVIAFESFDEKAEFLGFLGFDERATIVSGGDFINAIKEMNGDETIEKNTEGADDENT